MNRFNVFTIGASAWMLALGFAGSANAQSNEYISGLGTATAVAGGEFAKNGTADWPRYNFIGGGNYASGGAARNIIKSNGGAGTRTEYAAICGGEANYVEGYRAFIGAGQSNQAYSTADNGGIVAGQSNVVSGSHSFVGAGWSNEVSSAGQNGAIVTGEDNAVSARNAFVGGGHSNQADAEDAVVAAGYLNYTAGIRSFIGAGYSNYITADYAVIVGGYDNSATDVYTSVGGGSGNASSDDYATVAGGYSNAASVYAAAVCGGYDNTASASYAAVVGGYQNYASGSYAATGGGYSNVASGSYSTVPGGNDNTASGVASFAAGRSANANYEGCFVWGDNNASSLSCGAANRWVARASGGVWFYSNSGATTGVKLDPGEGAWEDASDRDLKSDIVPVDVVAVLDQVAALPLSEWRYTDSLSGAKHIGPMAQDFHEAFGLGSSDRHIAPLDTAGVSLAAIQALNAKVRALEALTQRLEQALTAENQHCDAAMVR